MPIVKLIDLNGFQFTLTTFNARTEVMIAIGDAHISRAIETSNAEFYAALMRLVQDYSEIDSVLLAEESLEMWLQSSYAENSQVELQRILNSTYASEDLKGQVSKALGLIPKSRLNTTGTEWYAMMYGVYQAMSDAEKEALHEWERKNVDGSGKRATSDWPGWEKYIGKRPTTSHEKTVRRGFIYLVRASTGEYKIGLTVDVGARVKAFGVQPPFEYEVVHTFSADNMDEAESRLHEQFGNKRIKGEWFSLDSSDVDMILQIKNFENGIFHNESKNQDSAER